MLEEIGALQQQVQQDKRRIGELEAEIERLKSTSRSAVEALRVALAQHDSNGPHKRFCDRCPLPKALEAVRGLLWKES